MYHSDVLVFAFERTKIVEAKSIFKTCGSCGKVVTK